MQIVHTDLDNTLIYSYKHEIGGPKTCVEIYQGREISFMTETSHRLLGQLCSKPGVLVVPTTTRTLEQYQRIDLGIGVPEYANKMTAIQPLIPKGTQLNIFPIQVNT